MKPHWSSLKRFLREQSGVAAIELAIAIPILTVCTLCAGDLGRFALQRTWVSYAASAGAEYAVASADNSFNASKITAAATAAAPVSGISVSPTPTEFYGCATATGVTASTQGATCPSNTSTGGTAGKYVSVTATMPFSAMFSAAGISYPSTLTATAVVRIQ
ncbi:MAG TPA: TadE/TadG family type IV pilus assembly protein [Roseiarcus sp.]